MCSPLIYDESRKRVIAAEAAAFRQVTRSPFGEDDEIGMLNLISPDSMRDVMKRADFGKVIDLSVDYFSGMPSFTDGGQPAYQLWMTNTPRGEVIDDSVGVGKETNERVSYSGDAVSMYTHTGTHIDTLNHFGYHNKIWNNFDADDHLESEHWDVCGAEKHPPIIARGILLDFPTAFGVEVLPESYGITAEDVRQVLDRQGTEIRPGDVVMVRSGMMTHWPANAYKINEAGITREAAEFIALKGAIVIGADSISLEQIPSTEEGNWLPVHTFLFAEAGISIMEVVNLDPLANEGIYEYAFIGAGLKLTGATAAPMRPLAMPLLSSY